MAEQKPGEGSESQASFWNRQLPLETETCFFILVNALDVFMTYTLLQHGPEFQESNAIAHYFLVNYGFRAMVYFKFVLVAFVTVIAQIIARTRPTTARWLLNVGTAIVAGVVIYSSTLWVNHSGYFDDDSKKKNRDESVQVGNPVDVNSKDGVDRFSTNDLTRCWRRA